MPDSRLHRPTSSRARRRVALTLATALVAAGVATGVVTPTPIAAADPPGIYANNPGVSPAVDLDSLDPTPIKQWGVVGSGTSYSAAKPEVWDIVELGNRIFVGGNFTGVQRDGDDPTSQVIGQPYLAAFDRDTGEWISTFRPAFNRTVYALEVSPTGKLLVGGEFTSANGATRAGLVALDPLTGATDPTFGAYVEGTPSMVREIVRDGDNVYLAGQFYYVRGAGPAIPWMGNAARINGTTGRLDISFIPRFAGGIWDIAIDKDRGRFSAAGYFTSTNGQPGTARMATVNLSNGSFIPGLASFVPNQASQPDTVGIVYMNNRLYVGGAQHIVQVLNADTNQRVGYHTVGTRCTAFNPGDCGIFYGGGDTQTMEATSNGLILYGCHCFGDQYRSTPLPLHYNTFTGTFSNRRYAIAISAADSTPSGSFIPGLRGRVWGTYAIETDSRGCYYVGGDYNRTSSGAWIGGFARFCKPVAGVTGLTGTAAGQSATITWNAAPSQLPVAYYKVYRNGTFVGDTTSLTYTVGNLPANTQQSFTVVTRDVSGRISADVSTVVTIGGGDTVAPSVPGAPTISLAGNTVTLSWGASTDNPGGVGLSGYLIHRNWEYLKFVPAGTTITTDVVGSGVQRYQVRAVDKNNNISAPTDIVRVTAP